MMWLTRLKKGKKRSSQQDESLSVASANQSAATLRHANRTSETSSTIEKQPAQTTRSSPHTLNRTGKYGLFLLSPQSDAVEVEETFSLDIVALHGITGDAYDTWTHENGTFWLRDFLPKEFPGARIFSFGYPAEVFCTLGTGDLDSFARSLLEDLKCERRRKEVGG
jgi:hypothetical protein